MGAQRKDRRTPTLGRSAAVVGTDRVKVVSCLQDGVGGSPHTCGITYGGGNSAY